MGSEGVWRCINTKYFGKNLYRSCQLRYCLLFQCPLIRKNAYVWGVSGWCLWVSDAVWIISGGVWQMSGEYRCHINHKQLNRSHHIKLLPFLPVTSHGQKVLNFWVSVGCLEGVWKVSGGCLGDSGYCLEGYNAKSIDKSSKDMFLISWFVFSQWLPIGQHSQKLKM